MKRQSFEILGTKIDTLTNKEAVSRFSELLEMKSPSLVCTPNPEFLITALGDKKFADILNINSRLNIPDGIGLLWAGKFLSLRTPKNALAKPIVFIQWLTSILIIPIFPNFFRSPIPEKISGSDFVWDIARIAAQRKVKLFLLGGAATVPERAALKLQTDIPDLRIAGVHSGTPNETEEIISAVNNSKAEILLVCFGAPKQEKWLADNLARTSCKIGVGLGGTFDFIAGERTRAPKLMQKLGLEWLYRLLTEPKRIKRQFAIPKFLWLILKEKMGKS